MKVLFAGSGAFGIPSLAALVDAGLPPSLVISAPDRPAGRDRRLTPAPLAAEARRLGLPLLQPERINRAESVDCLASESPDVLVVVSYGQILRRRVLDLPRLGCVNVHGSLLPRHRGASPIAAALLAGDAETGVSLMRMDEGLDSGPVFAVEATPVLPGDTAGALHDRLALLGAPLLVRVLRGLEDGSSVAAPQDPAKVSVCGLLKKDDGHLDWSRPAAELARRVAAFTPWPGAFTIVRPRGVVLRLLVEGAVPLPGHRGRPGEILRAEGNHLEIATGEGALGILAVKPSGKKLQTVAEFLRGYPLTPGELAG